MAIRSMLRTMGSARLGQGVRADAAGAATGDAATVSVTERLQMLEALEESEVAWFWATDGEGRLAYLSPSALRRLGRDGLPADLMLADLLENIPAENEEAPQRPLAFILGARNRFAEQVYRVKCVDAASYWSMTGRPHFDVAGEFIGYRGSAKDVTDSFQQQMDASRLAQYDSLTGLSNRHRMERRLDQVLAASLAGQRSCALMMLDLDRFKQVNDTLGHPAGDALLRQVAERLRAVIGEKAEIGRLGGDEFQLILTDVDDRGKLGAMAERVIQILSQPYALDEGQRAVIGTSIGIAIAPYDGLDRDELVHAADLALYEAKRAGRNRMVSSDGEATAIHCPS